MSIRTISSKIVVWLLTLIMVLSLLPVGALAADKGTFSPGNDPIPMSVGDTATLQGTYNNMASESWSTDNASVAAIQTTSGHTSTDYSYYYNVVTAKGNGTAHITHTLSSFWGDPTTETWTITVGGGSSTQESSITLDKSSVSIDLANSTKTATVTATVKGCTVSGVSCSNTSVATVISSGNTITVTGVAVGTATVTVSGRANNGYSAPESKTFTVMVTDSTPIPGGGGTSSTDGLTVSKTADKAGQSIDSSDTVTLDLEAYATGTTVTVPGSGEAGSYDVVLVLDTTFSMNNSIGNTTRLAALKSAVGTMIDALPTDASSKEMLNKRT